MPNSPLISKIRCHNPNLRKSKVCNRNYLIYIGTREGVDLSDVNMSGQELQLENLNDASMSEESANDLYAKYIAERPGSNGLFGNVDVSDVKRLGNDLANLTAQGRNVYRGIVSLSGDDAVQLGYTQKENWVRFIRSTIPDVAHEFGIPVDRLRWCAAVHMEKDHPHSHYMFWDSAGKVQSPYIHSSKQNKCRELLSKEMFKAEYEQAIIDKTLARDNLISDTKNLLEQKIYSPIVGRISNQTMTEYGEKLYTLTNELPSTGRLLYKLLPPDQKKSVDLFVDDILHTKELAKEYSKYKACVNKISGTYSASNAHAATNWKIADADIRKRLANAVLKECAKIRKETDFYKSYHDKLVNYPDTKEFDPTEYIHDNFSEVSPEKIYDEDYQDIAESEYISDISFKYEYSKDYKEALQYIYAPLDRRDIPKAFEILQKLADTNNVLALQELAKLYERELIPDITSEESAKYCEYYYKRTFEGLQTLEHTGEKPKAAYAYKLGKLYEKGNGTVQDYSAAKSCYEAAISRSQNGYKYAEYSLGNMYLHENIEKFTENNRLDLISKGLSHMKAAASQDFAYAAYTYAKISEKEFPGKLDPKELYDYYSQALAGFDRMLKERADDFLLYRVGTMYYDGKGTEINKEIAYDYFLQSAEYNNPNAQYALGKTYADPESPHYNPKKAILYFKSAFENGLAYANTALGDFYADSEAPVYDIEKAITAYTSAIDAGDTSASYKLGNLYSNKDSEYYNLDKAFDYFKASYTQGNMLAAYKLGKIYSDPETAYFDLDKALHYLEKAHNYGNMYATYKLGTIYANQMNNCYEPTTALSYLNTVCEQLVLSENESEIQLRDAALYQTGKLYLDSESPLYAPATGLKYLNESAAHENVNALAKLGNIYLWGNHPGIEKDVEKGLAYLQHASDLGNEYATESIRFYEDVQNNIAKSFAIRIGYRCFSSLFGSMVSARQSQDTYAALKAFRSVSKAAQKAEATKKGKYVDRET